MLKRIMHEVDIQYNPSQVTTHNLQEIQRCANKWFGQVRSSQQIEPSVDIIVYESQINEFNGTNIRPVVYVFTDYLAAKSFAELVILLVSII